MRNRSLLAYVAFFLTCVIVLSATLFVSDIYQRRKEERRKELELVYDSLYEEGIKRQEEYAKKREEERRLKKEREETYSAYQRLSEKDMTTTVLYLGGQSAYGVGVNPVTQSWVMLLRDRFEASFAGYTVRKTALAKEKDTNVLQYANIRLQSFIAIYDLRLLFLSIPSNEDYVDFAREYEKIVRTAKENNQKTDIVCIIEHAQSEADAQAIIEICKHYKLLYVDMRQDFKGREQELSLEDRPYLPNVEGHKLYADKIFEEISFAVSEQRRASELEPTGVYITEADILQIKELVN